MLNWDTYQQWLGSVLQGKLPVYMGNPPHPNKITIDSRIISKGQWFLPIIGENHDGHKYIADSIKKGCSGFFYQPDKIGIIPKELLKKGIPVKDTLQALQLVAKGWRLYLKNLKLIALTGSVGKTTTKEMTFQILKNFHSSHCTQGNLNNEIGVPLTLLQLNENHRYAVIELGARHLGDISFLGKIVSADVVACLNIGTAHLGEFGSQKNLEKAKLEIFTSCPDSAICIANADDQRILKGAKSTFKKVISFGFNSNANIQLISETWGTDGSLLLSLEINKGKSSMSLGSAHKAYGINAIASIAICQALGISQIEILKGLESFKGIKGRYKLIANEKGYLIDDCYNANPESMKAGMESLVKSFPNKNKILILGDMLELGDETISIHKELGQFVAKIIKPLKLFTVGNLAKYIAQGAHGSGLNYDDITAFKNVQEIINSKLIKLNSKDIIYLKASNGIGLSKLLSTLL